MKTIFDILVQGIGQDSISLVFTLIITVFFLIGAIPGLVLISSHMLNKIPLLGKVSNRPIVLFILGSFGIIFGIYIGLHSWFFTLVIMIFFFIVIAPRLSTFPLVNTLSVNPSLLTTMGILGTFIGIYIGLHNFNITDIDRSIPGLLAGLKIAFTTSIVGIVGAILLKIVQSIQIPSDKEKKESALDIFENINITLKNHLEQSKIQHHQTLSKMQDNIDLQSKILQLLHIKINSPEDSVRRLKETLKESITENTSKEPDSSDE